MGLLKNLHDFYLCVWVRFMYYDIWCNKIYAIRIYVTTT